MKTETFGEGVSSSASQQNPLLQLFIAEFTRSHYWTHRSAVHIPTSDLYNIHFILYFHCIPILQIDRVREMFKDV
jgi:hypothetical protein